MTNYTIKKIKLGLKAFTKINNWWDFFLDYLKLKKGYIIYKIGDKKIKTRARTIDKAIITEVVLEELYFPKLLKLPDNAIVIDVGAHIGSFSVLIHNKMKNGQVYAIEPSKQNYELLLDQIGINDLKIKSFKIALSDKKGKMKLYEGNHSARGSLFREEGKNFEIIETQTMKNFFEENKIEKCDLMKMDIEGGEYSVLYSTPKEIFDKIDKIFLEVHEIDGQNKLDLIEFLNKQGFKIEIKDKSFIYAVK